MKETLEAIKELKENKCEKFDTVEVLMVDLNVADGFKTTGNRIGFDGLNNFERNELLSQEPSPLSGDDLKKHLKYRSNQCDK